MNKLTAMILLMIGTTASAFAAVHAVPEIDPGSSLSGLALISGSLLVIRGRRKA
jgi:LPXTG-motif cell wall-anchored protein